MCDVCCVLCVVCCVFVCCVLRRSLQVINFYVLLLRQWNTRKCETLVAAGMPPLPSVYVFNSPTFFYAKVC